jgi:hypothetical protein
LGFLRIEAYERELDEVSREGRSALIDLVVRQPGS